RDLGEQILERLILRKRIMCELDAPQIVIATRSEGGPLMDRRNFICALASSLVTMALDAAGTEQTPKIYRIGWLQLGGAWALGPFRRGLNELGLIEGQNIIIEERFADNNPDRLATLADELVRLKVDV